MGRIPEDIISQIIDKTDIVATIGSYIPLKRVGRSFKALCPFHHEKTPSFIVNPDRQIYRCFGCGEGGNVLGFIMKHERLEFPEAVRMLADKAGIVIPETRTDPAQDSLRQKIFAVNEAAVEYFQANLMSSSEPEVKAARDYLKSRRINADCARHFKLGYVFDSWDGIIKHLQKKGFDQKVIGSSGLVVAREDGRGFYDRFRGRLIFPIFDHRGRPVAFGARALKKEERAKYINSPETAVYTKGQHLYGFNLSKEAVGSEDAAVIVEGYLDFIRPFAAGVENVAASLGTALTIDQIRLVRRYTHNVIMLYDMDSAGQTATLRSLDVLLAEEMNVRIATLAEGEDPDSFILKYGVEEFRSCLASARDLFDFEVELLSRQYGESKAESRAKICQEMIPTIDKIPNEVVKENYLTKLAQRFKLPDVVLRQMRQRLQSKQTSRAVEEVGTAIRREDDIPRDEGILLRLMLSDRRWLALARKTVGPESFRHPATREIVDKLYGLFDVDLDMSTAVLLEQLEDGRARKLVAATADNNDIVGGDAERVFNDCLARLKRSLIKEKRERLRTEIRRAEKEGSRDKVLDLQKEFNQLIKE
ncbi:MAG: DNA primase [Candidatus Omnitrophica bacterium]|nr:DNA primase [Candidatus Omnitrophota bacterium]